MNYLFILLFSLLPAPEMHAFHISKCQIDYNTADKALQITWHIFIDDLEEALRRQGMDKLFLGTEREAANGDAAVEKYLLQRLKLIVNGKSASINFIGKENSEDLAALWCYLEVPGVSAVQNMNISNDILLEVYDDQKNLVSVTVPGKKQGYFIFEKGKTSAGLKY